MLVDIKNTFKNALIFGFTGTPIQDLNAKKDSTTPTIFGDEIHRYTLGDGIRDKNVLGFDPYMVRIYDDADIREKVALSKASSIKIKLVRSLFFLKTFFSIHRQVRPVLFVARAQMEI